MGMSRKKENVLLVISTSMLVLGLIIYVVGIVISEREVNNLRSRVEAFQVGNAATQNTDSSKESASNEDASNESADGKAEDVKTADVISAAMSAALANEDAYDEYYAASAGAAKDKVNPQSGQSEKVAILIRIGQNGEVTACTGDKLDNLVREVKTYLEGRDVKIQYQENGADHWLVGVGDDAKPRVYVVNKDETKDWILGPQIADDYR